MSKGSSAINWAGLVGLGLLFVLVVLVVALPLADVKIDSAWVRDWARELGVWGPLAVAGLEMAQVIVSPISGYAVEVTSGYLYGPWLGTLYCMAGIVSGSTLIFLLARRYGRPFIARHVSTTDMTRLDSMARRGGSLLFFLIWLLPFLPDDLACVAAGLTPMPAGQFLFLMAAGRLPGIATGNWVGSHAGQVSPALWIAGLAVMAIAAIAAWRWGDRLQAAMLAAIDRLAGRPERS